MNEILAENLEQKQRHTRRPSILYLHHKRKARYSYWTYWTRYPLRGGPQSESWGDKQGAERCKPRPFIRCSHQSIFIADYSKERDLPPSTNIRPSTPSAHARACTNLLGGLRLGPRLTFGFTFERGQKYIHRLQKGIRWAAGIRLRL